MDETGLTDTYIDAMAVVPFLLEQDHPIKILVIGVAGGSVIRQIRHFANADRYVEIDAVEIDPKMFSVAKDYFGLQDTDAKMIVEDGRTFLRNSTKMYDIIMVDAYQQELYIPFHLATVEFFELARSRLKEDGLMALNVIGDVQDDPLVTYFKETVRSVFHETASTQMEGNYNHMIIASPSQISWQNLERSPEPLKTIADHLLIKHQSVNKTDHILTDDRAPVEYLTDQFLFKTIYLFVNAN